MRRQVPFEAPKVVLMGRTVRFGTFGQPGWQDRDIAMGATQPRRITDLAPRDCPRLSGSQKQLFPIARALAQEAPLIVMDGPTASLDFGNEAQALAQITALSRDAASDGRGVILSTHDPNPAFALNAGVFLIKGRKTHADGPAKELLTGSNLSDIYGLPVSVEVTETGRYVCLPMLGRQCAPTMTSDAFTIA